MMTTETELLDDVLFSFRLEHARPTSDAVRSWISRYPQFADDIREVATLWAERELQATLNRPSPADESLVLEARSAALNALHNASFQRQRPIEASTLVEAVYQAATSVQELGRQMALTSAVVSRILGGKIMGATIPETLTRMLARTLKSNVNWIKDRYPNGSIMAYATALDDPSISTRTSDAEAVSLTFQQAIMDANGMDDVQRRFWLEAV